MTTSGKPLDPEEREIAELHQIGLGCYEGRTTKGRRISISFVAGVLDISIDAFGNVVWDDELEGETLEKALHLNGYGKGNPVQLLERDS